MALTVAERSFLQGSGWSAVHRSEVEWPSLLELGPHGWVMQVALIVAAVLGLVFAACLFTSSSGWLTRFAALSLALMSLAVGAMALPPDPAGTTSHSWHDIAHNDIYPVIPTAALVAAVMFGFGYKRSARRASTASSVFIAVAIAALGLSTVDAIAQLVRYVFFAALLGWVIALALVLGRPSAAGT